MTDLYAGKYATAANPYVTADGVQWASVDDTTRQSFIGLYGTTDAPIVWAEQHNLDLLNRGQAILTSHGVVLTDNVKFALGKAGYNAPQDPSSLAQAYELLQSPAPGPPLPPGAPPAPVSAAHAALTSLPKPALYVGVALVAYVVLGGKVRL